MPCVLMADGATTGWELPHTERLHPVIHITSICILSDVSHGCQTGVPCVLMADGVDHRA